MNTSRSRRKLDEAKFFLEKLEEPHCTFPDFNYYLSAYFSAARSVSWVLKAEHGKKVGFTAWYNSFSASSDDEAFMKVINSIRVRTEKHEPVDAVPALIAGIPIHASVPETHRAKELALRSKRSMTHNISDGLKVTLKPAQTSDYENNGIERHLPEFPNYDVTIACHRYYLLVERLVVECEKWHAA